MLSYRERRRLQEQSRYRQPSIHPQKHWLIRTINSPLAIWFYSAVFITAGGTLFSEIRECRIDAERVIDMRERLQEELALRRAWTLVRFLPAKSIKEFSESDYYKRRAEFFRDPDLKGLSIGDLQVKWERLAKKILIPADGRDAELTHFDLDDFSYHSADERELVRLKVEANKELLFMSVWRHKQKVAQLDPDCGVIVSIRRMLTGVPKTVVVLTPDKNPIPAGVTLKFVDWTLVTLPRERWYDETLLQSGSVTADPNSTR